MDRNSQGKASRKLKATVVLFLMLVPVFVTFGPAIAGAALSSFVSVPTGCPAPTPGDTLRSCDKTVLATVNSPSAVFNGQGIGPNITVQYKFRPYGIFSFSNGNGNFSVSALAAEWGQLPIPVPLLTDRVLYNTTTIAYSFSYGVGGPQVWEYFSAIQAGGGFISPNLEISFVGTLPSPGTLMVVFLTASLTVSGTEIIGPGGEAFDYRDSVAQGPSWSASTDTLSYPVGTSFRIDPTTVATASVFTPASTAAQRKCFGLIQTRYWCFFGISAVGSIYYSSSLDNKTWTTPTAMPQTDAGGPYGEYFSVDTYGSSTVGVVSMYPGGGNSITYTQGTLASGGSVSWGAEQYAVCSHLCNYLFNPGIKFDSAGYPWVSYTRFFAGNGTYLPYVLKDSVNTGTWTNATGFPHKLSATSSVGWTVELAAIYGQKMVAVYSAGNATVNADSWTGSAWNPTAVSTVSSAYAYKETGSGAPELAVDSGKANVAFFSVSNVQGLVGIIMQTTTHTVVYESFSYATNTFSAETTIVSTLKSNQLSSTYWPALPQNAPALSVDNSTGNLYVFYENSTALMFIKRVSGTWDANPLLWFKLSTVGVGNSGESSYYQGVGVHKPVIGVMWGTSASNPPNSPISIWFHAFNVTKPPGGTIGVFTNHYKGTLSLSVSAQLPNQANRENLLLSSSSKVPDQSSKENLQLGTTEQTPSPTDKQSLNLCVVARVSGVTPSGTCAGEITPSFVATDGSTVLSPQPTAFTMSGTQYGSPATSTLTADFWDPGTSLSATSATWEGIQVADTSATVTVPSSPQSTTQLIKTKVYAVATPSQGTIFLAAAGSLSISSISYVPDQLSFTVNCTNTCIVVPPSALGSPLYVSMDGTIYATGAVWTYDSTKNTVTITGSSTYIVSWDPAPSTGGCSSCGSGIQTTPTGSQSAAQQVGNQVGQLGLGINQQIATVIPGWNLLLQGADLLVLLVLAFIMVSLGKGAHDDGDEAAAAFFVGGAAYFVLDFGMYSTGLINALNIPAKAPFTFKMIFIDFNALLGAVSLNASAVFPFFLFAAVGLGVLIYWWPFISSRTAAR